MALDMRALYYISLPEGLSEGGDRQLYEEYVKANENCLNQNFTLLANKIYEYEQRIAALESERGD